MNKLILVWGLLVSNLVACVPRGGDMVVRVSGSIPENSTLPCELSMKSEFSESNRSLGDVETTFSRTLVVTVGPDPKSYHLTADCRDGTKYRSRSIRLSSKQREPIALGDFFVDAENSK